MAIAFGSKLMPPKHVAKGAAANAKGAIMAVGGQEKQLQIIYFKGFMKNLLGAPFAL